jgi:putative nucleotidyltransferase with HDIG domain
MINGSKESISVLFVEDDPNDVDLMLKELGTVFDVVWKRVDNEIAFLANLDTTWDVVLCDFKLPSFSPARVVDIIRQSIFTRINSIPVIVVSNVVREDVVVGLLKIGINDFIRKGDTARLIFSIKRELRRANLLEGTRLRAEIRIRESYDMTIEAWGIALELRDVHSAGHTHRVANLTLRLALHLGLDSEDFVYINRGALLHDIGKMGIPDSVLLKEGPLSPEESVIMKKHPQLAFDMLRDIPFLSVGLDGPRCALHIPYCHHEHWDGTGYPRGLKGTEIPFYSRMFSVIDVYDALTTDRPYRKSWDKAKTIAYLLDQGGTQLDPTLVSEFVEMMGRA